MCTEHYQVRDWDSPTFRSLGPCDRCGETAVIEWRKPTWWEWIIGEEEK